MRPVWAIFFHKTFFRIISRCVHSIGSCLSEGLSYLEKIGNKWIVPVPQDCDDIDFGLISKEILFCKSGLYCWYVYAILVAWGYLLKHPRHDTAFLRDICINKKVARAEVGNIWHLSVTRKGTKKLPRHVNGLWITNILIVHFLPNQPNLRSVYDPLSLLG